MNLNQTNVPRIQIERMFVKTSFFDIITQVIYSEKTHEFKSNECSKNSNRTNVPRIQIERMFVKTSFFDIITQVLLRKDPWIQIKGMIQEYKSKECL